ncbi:MAG: alkaline phosphatase family protein [Alphaproteobacteria bacterium]
MLNTRPLDSFEPLGVNLLKPQYTYSFGNIPNTIYTMLTGEQNGPLLPVDCFGGSYPQPEKVVLFFIDALGWKFWQDHLQDIAPMRRIAENGVLTPISSLFPSTTSAAVSTMNLGVLPAEHACYEWNLYVPAYGETIQSLPFAPLGKRQSDACLEKGYDPRALFAVHETVHQRLAAQGVRSLLFENQSYAKGAVNQIFNAGAELYEYSTLAESLTQLKEALATVKGKAWFNVYWGGIDHIGHRYGPSTPYFDAEIISFWATFDALLRNLNSPNTLYLFTADHGQVSAPIEDTFYINERIPALADCLSTSPTGNVIYPGGSPRDLFMHVKSERREEAFTQLTEALTDIAHVMTVDDAVTQGLFGPSGVGAELRRRLGDILVLPFDGHFVYWREPGVLHHDFSGHHGGLAASELITVLGATEEL